MGIKCSIANPESPHKDKQRHWIPMALFLVNILDKLVRLIFWIKTKT